MVEYNEKVGSYIAQGGLVPSTGRGDSTTNISNGDRMISRDGTVREAVIWQESGRLYLRWDVVGRIKLPDWNNLIFQDKDESEDGYEDNG